MKSVNDEHTRFAATTKKHSISHRSNVLVNGFKPSDENHREVDEDRQIRMWEGKIEIESDGENERPRERGGEGKRERE